MDLAAEIEMREGGVLIASRLESGNGNIQTCCSWRERVRDILIQKKKTKSKMIQVLICGSIVIRYLPFWNLCHLI